MIEASYFWTIVFFMMIGTLSIRGSVIVLSSRVKIPERLRELFSYIPAAILPAFIVPSNFFHQGHIDWLQGKERLLVLGLSAVICLLTKSTVSTIVFGLLALAALIHYF